MSSKSSSQANSQKWITTARRFVLLVRYKTMLRLCYAHKVLMTRHKNLSMLHSLKMLRVGEGNGMVELWETGIVECWDTGRGAVTIRILGHDSIIPFPPLLHSSNI